MTRLLNKSALISGAASGIGRATAIRFLAEGGRVCALDVDREGLDLLAATHGTDRVLAIPTDVRSESEVKAATEQAEDELGGLDVIVSCAGIEPASDDRVDQLSLEVWRNVLDVNVTGVFTVVKHGVPALRRSGGGAVVLTASPTSLYGIAADQHAYSASKGAIIGLTKSMAAAYASEGIRVNAVMPGLTNTPANEALLADAETAREIIASIPLGRAAEPDEIAAIMVTVASEDAAYATGAVFTIDGGMTAI